MSCKKSSLIVFICFFINIISAQQVSQEGYIRFVDSAKVYVEEDYKKATFFLDSIPEPFAFNLKDHLADFYKVKALINNRFGNQAELYQNFSLALKYAKLEENYDIAGMACIELFYNTYLIKKDSSAYHYLADAKKYYTLSKNKNGLAEVKQMPAFIEFFKKNYKESISLLLHNLDEYKALQDDAYYYMYALFMISSNYIHLGDLDNGHKYLKELKKLKSNPTISNWLYDGHVVTLNTCLAEIHLENKQLDSTFYYLKESGKLRYAMDNIDIEHYFNLYVDYYDHKQDSNSKNAFVDSLKVFENSLLKKTVDASLKINETLLETENQLEIAEKKKQSNFNLFIVIFLILIISLLIIVIYWKQLQSKFILAIRKTDSLSNLKTNYDNLKIKVFGLEGYISEIKKEVKVIATLEEPKLQSSKIKELYKDMRLKSSIQSSSDKTHLNLIRELNNDFFIKIKEDHPILNESEIIVCYYLFMGFTNKEISSFLNISIRAVESKRYRINIKLDLKKTNQSLFEYLQSTFQ